jgi:DGQHR domain-containing protein
MGHRELLQVPALEIRQGPNRLLYSFAVDGKQLPRFTTISRIHRDEATHIQGYQRPEVLSHISSIRRYLESPDPMIPNALVVAFDSRVHFEPQPTTGSSEFARQGTLVIPIEDDWADPDKPGWIVDGQQRCAAIRDAKVDSFPICVTAFITDSDIEQRSQFILVNSTKPLPKGLIYELLPATSGTLPTSLQLRRFPAYLLDRLNHDKESPLRELIQTPTSPEGVIKDNSVLKMLEHSISDGALYRFRDPASGKGDAEAMLGLLTSFWQAVKDTFPEAWGIPPRKSRMMHGVGIISLGFLMDAIADRYWRITMPGRSEFAKDLEALRDVCRWTHGHWDFGPHAQLKWNELQNTPKDVQRLTNYLLFEYKARVWSRPLEERKEA